MLNNISNNISNSVEYFNNTHIEKPTESKSLIYDFLVYIYTLIIGIYSFFINTISTFGNLISKIIIEFWQNITKSFTSEELKYIIFKYSLFYLFIFILIVVLNFASNDVNTLTSRYYVYAIMIIMPLIGLFYYILQGDSSNSGNLKNVFMIGTFLTLFAAVLYFYSSINLSDTAFSYVSYLINIIILLIVLFGLAIFFYIFGNYLKSLNNIAGFIVYIIFYIPCLIIDFLTYLLKEIRMTSKLIYALFIIEILLILLYVYSSVIVNYLTKNTSNNIVLLNDSQFLNTKSTISNSYYLKMENNSDNTPFIYRRNYAISMWIYLNNQPPNNLSYSKETEIFNYGNGKPRITYFNDASTPSTKDKYIFYFTDLKNGTTNSYTMTLPNQKWNNIVFNYNSDKVDLFINGILERTFVFNNNMPNYLSTDTVSIGAENGLDGAICNINYYKEPLTKSKIAINYNLLKMKNPPLLV